MERDHMIDTFTKDIHKTDRIKDIFKRSQDFFDISKKSKLFRFPEVISLNLNQIEYEKIDFSHYKSGYELKLQRGGIQRFAQVLYDFYLSVSDKGIDFSQKQVLHGDLHLGNIFFPNKDDEKILFIDPETPNSLNYEMFTYNKVSFEIAYMLYHMDNHSPIWNRRFYSNNVTFKEVFFEEFEKNIDPQYILEWKKDLLLEYKNHIYRKFEFSYNPVLLLHRCFRFVIIYTKFILWRV